MIKRFAFSAGLLFALTHSLEAQAPGLDVRLGAQTAMPTGPLASGFDYGYGLYGRIGIPMGAVSLMGSATWTRFKPSASSNVDFDILTLQAGPHFMVIPGMDIGIEGAYFSEVEKFGLGPNLSIGISNLEGMLSYNLTFDEPRTSWFALGIGLKF